MRTSRERSVQRHYTNFACGKIPPVFGSLAQALPRPTLRSRGASRSASSATPQPAAFVEARAEIGQRQGKIILAVERLVAQLRLLLRLVPGGIARQLIAEDLVMRRI